MGGLRFQLQSSLDVSIVWVGGGRCWYQLWVDGGASAEAVPFNPWPELAAYLQFLLTDAKDCQVTMVVMIGCSHSRNVTILHTHTKVS